MNLVGCVRPGEWFRIAVVEDEVIADGAFQLSGDVLKFFGTASSIVRRNSKTPASGRADAARR